VLDGSTVLTNGSIIFSSDATKNHPVNINYTGNVGEALTLRLDRTGGTGDGQNIAVDDVRFAQVPEPSTLALLSRVAWPASPRARVGVARARIARPDAPRLSFGKRPLAGLQAAFSFFSAPIMKRQRLVSQGSLSRLFHQPPRHGGDRIIRKRSTFWSAPDGSTQPTQPFFSTSAGPTVCATTTPAAERCLEKAVRLAAQKTQVLVEAGRRCQEFGHHPMATRFFERVVQHDERAVDAIVTLAELYERHHRTAEADVLIERALRVDAVMAVPWWRRRVCETKPAERTKLRAFSARCSQRPVRLLDQDPSLVSAGTWPGSPRAF